jgi:hypothetical protein
MMVVHDFVVPTSVAAPWLATTLSLAGVTWVAIHAYRSTRARACALGALVAATVASLPGAFLPLSHAAPWSPPVGTYDLIGASMTPNQDIYVLLKVDGEPRLYVMPWNVWKANQIQEALDAINSGDGDGSMSFTESGGWKVEHRDPVHGDDTKKQPELPVVPGQ